MMMTSVSVKQAVRDPFLKIIHNMMLPRRAQKKKKKAKINLL
jgi:hypothetical protein